MKVYLINLDKDVKRLTAVDAQLKRLGVDYERISAVYAKGLSQNELDNTVNKFRWWCAMARLPWIGEIGCAMSHYSIYRRITEPACVLEDDVVLDDRFLEVLTYVESHLDISKPQVILLSNHNMKHCADEGRHLGSPLIQKIRFDEYAEGYIITPKAAQVLLNKNMPLQSPCDHWWRWSRWGVIELYHALPTVCSQNQSETISGTVDPTCFRTDEASILKKGLYKMKRIVGLTIDNILLAFECLRRY